MVMFSSDKILIKKPDGTFELVAVESGERAAAVKAKIGEQIASKQPEGKTLSSSTKKKAPAPANVPAGEPKDFTQASSSPSHPSPSLGHTTRGNTEKGSGSPFDENEEGRGDREWEKQVDEVMRQLKHFVQEKGARDRLRNIILSRLKDVRDFLGTKEALTKDQASGGLGLSEADAAGILNTIEASYKKLHERMFYPPPPAPLHSMTVEDIYQPSFDAAVVSPDEIAGTKQGGYQKILATYVGKEKVADKPSRPESPIPAPPVASPVEKGKMDKGDNFSRKEKKKEIEKAKESYKGQELPEFPAVNQRRMPDYHSPRTAVRARSSRPIMEDVKTAKRLVGPVEELQKMRLIDFRRMGETTSDRLRKVLDHINALEEESFSLKVGAIKAWRSSPLYRQYIAVGQKSLAESKSVSQVIRELKEQGKDILTYEEFERITDFNKELRY